MFLSLLTLFGVFRVQVLSGTIHNSREQRIQTDGGNVQQREHERGKGWPISNAILTGTGFRMCEKKADKVLQR